MASSVINSSFVLVSLMLMLSSSCALADGSTGRFRTDLPCAEVYVVGEGETLHTISDRCGDPFIVEQNPHIQDPDDVFPGLVIKITQQHTKLARKFLNRD
uniref:LysM domain-containing protein n=1 Tax=Kalanchoe fedtschenkoi TaxID=63787 RepID=A0A7N1A394_KALFE